MEKKLLRKQARQVLQNLPIDYKTQLGTKMAQQLFSSDFWKASSRIGVTLSREEEWDTKLIIEQAWAEQKRVCVPKCYPKTSQLIFFELTDFSQIECVYLDLKEPKIEETKQVEKDRIDLLIVPGLLFDHRGYRIGYGGGYYDRFLVDFPSTTIAIASEEQVMEVLPADDYDIPVQHLVTENGLVF